MLTPWDINLSFFPLVLVKKISILVFHEVYKITTSVALKITFIISQFSIGQMYGFKVTGFQKFARLKLCRKPQFHVKLRLLYQAH